jgi:hypothetical protein
MTWMVIEGLDRSGKSTVAQLYKTKGFQVVHFSAPNKKYTTKGYTGPSYLDDILDQLMQLTGKDVVFDRSWYGELIWPSVYGRQPLLSLEDLEIIREIEDQNDTQRILMHDPDVKAHWQRCVENNEPLDAHQFKHARDLYYRMAEEHGFILKTKTDFDKRSESKSEDVNAPNDPVGIRFDESSREILDSKHGETNECLVEVKNLQEGGIQSMATLTPEQIRLAEANAINDVLSKTIVKMKGEHYSSIENRIRNFLNQELATLLGTQKTQQQVQNSLTEEEVLVIRSLISRSKK